MSDEDDLPSDWNSDPLSDEDDLPSDSSLDTADGMQKKDHSHVNKVLDQLESDLPSILSKVPNVDIFADQFRVIDLQTSGQVEIFGGANKLLLQLLPAIGTAFGVEDDVQIEFIREQSVFDRQNVKYFPFLLSDWKIQLDVGRVPLCFEANIAFHINDDSKVDYLRINNWTVNGQQLQSWPVLNLSDDPATNVKKITDWIQELRLPALDDSSDLQSPDRDDESLSQPVEHHGILSETTNMSSSTDLSKLKSEFRLLAARANRGFSAGQSAQAELREKADALEAALLSTVDEASWEPTASPLLFGRWYLDFTDASDILSLSFLPIPAEIGDIYQEVQSGTAPGRLLVDNAVELLPPGSGVIGALTGIAAKGVYTVEGVAKPLSATKTSILFVGGRFQPVVSQSFSLPAIGGGLPEAAIGALQEALGALGEPIYLETTYLDENMRIGRGPRRELYVLSKREPET